jgi:hypothetical protein
MVRHIRFVASGEQFRPSEINFAFSKSIDVGMIGQEGAYKNQPVPNGLIVIEIPRQIPPKERLSYLVKTVKPLLPELKRAGATRLELDIARFYSTQCNEEYTSEELALMASLDCPFNYSAYKVSKKEESELEEKYGGP